MNLGWLELVEIVTTVSRAGGTAGGTSSLPDRGVGRAGGMRGNSPAGVEGGTLVGETTDKTTILQGDRDRLVNIMNH